MWIDLRNISRIIRVFLFATILCAVGCNRRSATVASDAPTTAKSISGTTIPEGWEKYTSPDARFSVVLPGKPGEQQKVDQSGIGPITVHSVGVNIADGAMSVMYEDLPDSAIKLSDPIKVIEGVGDDWINAVQGKNIRKSNVSYMGYPGKEYRIDITGSQYPPDHAADIRIYLIKSRIYQLMVVGKSHSIDGNPDNDMFFNSFTVLDAKPGSTLPYGAWRTVEIKQAGYSVEMPGEPTPRIVATDPRTGVPQSTAYNVEYDNQMFGATLTVLTDPPKTQSQIEKVFDAYRDDGMSKAGRTLVSDKTVSQQNMQGRELVVRSSASLVHSRSFIVNGHLLTLLYGCEPARTKFQDCDRFMDSFKLRK